MFAPICITAQTIDTSVMLSDTLVRVVDTTAASIAPSPAMLSGQDMLHDAAQQPVDSSSKVYNSSIIDLLHPKNPERGAFAWRINPHTFNLEEQPAFDTLLLQPQRNLHYQRELTPYISLGNLGGALQTTDFLKRQADAKFLFMRSFVAYQKPGFSRSHMHVRSPHTLLTYSMGGKSSQADLTLGVQHTQNVSPYLNFGLDYDYYSTKGMYARQLARDNVFSGYVSYYRNRVFAQFTVNSTGIKNQNNGGVIDEFFIRDTLLDSRLVPMKLSGASTELKWRGASLMGGFHFVEKRKRLKNIQGKDSVVIVKPIITGKLLLEYDRYKHLYADGVGDTLLYTDNFVHATMSHDTASLQQFNSMAMIEVSQIAAYPGIPGLRMWLGNTSGRYSYFDIGHYLYPQEAKGYKISTNYVGAGVFSNSDYLRYSGAISLCLNGYRAGDKEIFGEMTVLPWRSTELPYVHAELEISDRSPDVFMRRYASNHFRWENHFDRQQTFRISGEFGTERWSTWVGYSLAHVANYLYFDSLARPAQSSAGVTVTSAYVRNHLKFGPLGLINRLQWQKNSNQQVLSLPELTLYSSLFFQFNVVKNVLTAQIGASANYTTSFYADAYMPATAQFYCQREGKVGNYPFVDAFVNLKWYSALIFLKYEHLNQGWFDYNNYFSAYQYPERRGGFKFGVAWVFYD